MNQIVNVSRNWGIGRNGDLLAYIPEDMKYFRGMTKGKVVVMGRNTLDSFPGRRPLKGRVNIVLTSSPEHISPESYDGMELSDGVYSCDDRKLKIVLSADELREEIKKYPSEDVFVVGGGEIYRLLLPCSDRCYVTKNSSEEEADTYYPDLDSDPEWIETEKGEEHTSESGIKYRFSVYDRVGYTKNI